MALIRIFTVDFYMSPPIRGLDTVYSDFRGSSVHQVPIIRIFGSSETGSEKSTSVMYQVALKLDQAINTALGQTSSGAHHVHKVALVSGIPLYGYHPQEHQFLKIYFYNPLFMKKACNLLQNGNVLGKVYQLHEAHIPFVLQFMIDYNLHGMNYISLSEVRYRANPDNPPEDIPPELILPASITKISTSQVEADGLAEHIVNRLEVIPGQVTKNPGIAALWDDEMQRRRNKDENSQISPCLSQTRVNVPPTASHKLFRTTLKEKLLSKTNKQNQEDENSSVYPAETPKVRDILSASYVESHSPADSQSPFYSLSPDDTTEVDLSTQNMSVLNSTLNSSNLNDSDAMDLLEVLQDLGDNANIEEGSILSQMSKYQEESDEDNEADMTLPLIGTPTKIINQENLEEFKLHNTTENFLNVSSQLDNHGDDEEENATNKKKQKTINQNDDEMGTQYRSSLSGFQSNKNRDPNLSNLLECDTLLQDGTFSVEENTTHNFEHVPDRVKRQLSFIEISDILSKENLLVNKNDPVMKCIRNKSSPDKCSTDKQPFQATECAVNSELPFSLVSQQPECSQSTHNSTQNSEELFSGEMQTETSASSSDNVVDAKFYLDQNSDLTKAEIHDLEKNFVPAPGTSKTSTHPNELWPQVKQNAVTNSQSLSNCSTDSTSFPTLYQTFSHPELTQPNSVPKDDHGFINGEVRIGDLSKLSETLNFTQNLTILDVSVLSDNDTVTLCNSNILMPKFNPPSRDLIKSTMSEYNIPERRYQKPFYSDVADVTGEVQVGHAVLKVASATSDLADFECRSVDLGLQQLRKLQLQEMHPNVEITQAKLKGLKLSYCENVGCVITPSKLPPSRGEAVLWMKIKKLHVEADGIKKKEKLKILIPCSPGTHSDGDAYEDCISLSPFSPDDDKSCKSISIETDLQQTPKRSSKIKAKQTKKKCGKFKLKLQKKQTTLKNKIDDENSTQTFSKQDLGDKDSTLRKMLLQSQFLNHFASPTEVTSDSSRISGATQDNTHGFIMSLENLQKVKAISEHQCLTVLVVELHMQTRLNFRPDPQLDPIKAIFYSLFNDVPNSTEQQTGVIAINTSTNSTGTNVPILETSGVSCDIIYVDSETSLINEFIKFVRMCDPDICAGYEIEQLSWGYLIDRGYILNINLQSLLSRTQIKLNFADDETHSGLKLTGRVLLDVWRLMKHEVALQSYTFENIMYHVLHRRIPLHSFKDLSFWWEHRSSIYRHRTANFYISKVKGILELFNQLDLIGRTCELARLFGIQFYEVLSRGSQFRVESMMLRLAKPLNYVAVSSSVQQRAKMKAPESLPLILEPESKFYVDPVIVLDFQSLYPSIIIAYNYCYSTCLGRVEHLGQNMPFEFGTTQLKVSAAKLKRLYQRNLLNFSPCGVAYVKADVRQGILPRMLLEILDTRLMVKKSMKQNKDDKILQRVLHSRQLGLKLIANVTYGYTAANFSGRMPAVELGDSVVSKGRETLLRAIKLIENTPDWGAKVVYGDTDSVFVLVPGKSRECAFKIGAAIADAVTNDNPSPVKLKLEKIFQPCILQTKKRYVGYMYESVDQTEPEFCAKGIETVRRDGCPAVSKMLEKCLKLLFDTRDVSLVRKYVLAQFTKLLSGRVSLQDLIFAKEYRGASNYRPGACVPALELTRKWIAVDKRSEPRCGERVPYVIINGPPGLPLIKLVRSPRELLADHSLLPNVLYYITRAIIPPLNRCFTLIGVDLNTWFNNMPRKQIQFLNVSPDSTTKKRAISHYFATTSCIACNQQTQQGLCAECCSSPQESLVVLQNKIRLWERAHAEATMICQSCCGHPTITQCISLDCPVMYCVTKTNKDLQQVNFVQHTVSNRLNIDF